MMKTRPRPRRLRSVEPGVEVAEKRRGLRGHRRRVPAAWLMSGPGLLIAVGMSILIVGVTVWVVTHEYNLTKSSHQYIGGTYFSQSVHDAVLRSTLLTTLEYVAISLLVETVLGVGIALIIYYGIGATRVVRAVILVPMVTTPFVVGMVWKMLYDPEGGLLDGTLRALGLPSHYAFLANPQAALAAVIVMEVWHWTPFIILIVLAGLEGIPRETLEAVAVEGASLPQVIRYVILPLLKPTIAIAMLLRAIGLTQAFTEIFTATAGGPGNSTMVFNVYDYEAGFQLFHFGYATAIGVLYAIVILVTFTPLARRVLSMQGGVK